MTQSMSAGLRPGAVERFFRGGHRHFGEDRDLLVRPLGDARAHDVGVEDVILLDDEAAFDAGGLEDEFGARFLQRLGFAGGDGGGVRRR